MAMHHKPLFEGEKALEYAKAENKNRIKSLEAGRKLARSLAPKLRKCKPRIRCQSPACAVCVWFARRKNVRAIKRFLEAEIDDGKYKDMALLTLVPTNSFIDPEELDEVDVRRRHNTLTQRIRRSGLHHAIIIGGTEVTYKGDRKQVSVHEHLIVANCTIQEIESLRHWYADKSQGVREMRIDPIKRDTLKKVASYCLKNLTYGTDEHGRRKVRPPSHVENEHLLFLDRYTFRQLMFKKGVLFKGDKLVRITRRKK